jgi:hypothetical protein
VLRFPYALCQLTLDGDKRVKKNGVDGRVISGDGQ